MSSKPLTDKDGNVRELDAEDIRAMRPTEDVLPADVYAALPRRKPGQRGPQKAPTKEHIALRLDKEVIEAFRATGAGWQTRINDALRKAVNL